MSRIDEYRTDKTANYFQTYAASARLSPATKESYYYMIGLLCAHLKKDFLDIKEEDAKKFAEHLKNRCEEGEISRHTMRVRLYCYDRFGEFLYQADVIERNPFARIPKPVTSSEPVMKNIPSLEECDAMLAAARETGEEMYLIYCMSLRMALSLSDIMNLKTENILDFDGKTYLFYPDPEHLENNRYLCVPEDMEQLIRAHREASKYEYFFTNRKGEQFIRVTLEKRVRVIQKKCNLQDLSLKDLRNRAIFQMLHDGAQTGEVAKYVGLSMTRTNTFAQSPIAASEMLSICPANLSRIQVKQD